MLLVAMAALSNFYGLPSVTGEDSDIRVGIAASTHMIDPLGFTWNDDMGVIDLRESEFVGGGSFPLLAKCRADVQRKACGPAKRQARRAIGWNLNLLTINARHLAEDRPSERFFNDCGLQANRPGQARTAP